MTSRNEETWRKLPNLPKGHSVNGNVYTSRSIYKDEINKIFNKCWQFVCHESEVEKLNDFKTLEIIGQPILIVRGEDGRVRSFLNVCSHRGAKIVHELSGNSPKFQCFYHLWTYSNTGECISIPRIEGYQKVDLKKNHLGLREIRTEIFLGLVFINFDDSSCSLSEYIGDALEPFANTLGTGELEVFHYNSSVLNSNWKAWQETNLDLYHEWMHVLLRKTQIKAETMHHRKVNVFKNGHTSAGGLRASYQEYLGMKDRKDEKALPGLQANDFFFVDLFPNLAILARGTVIRIDVVTPINEKSSIVEWRGIGLKGDTEEDRMLRWSHHNQYWGPFGRNVPEDAFATEACEAGFRNGSAKHQIIARDESSSGQDDGMLRVWYKEWSNRTGRLPETPDQEEF